MPSVYYSGSFNGQRGSEGGTATLYASSYVPIGAVIDSVEYSIHMKSNRDSSDYYWNLNEFSVGGYSGGSPTVSGYKKMNGSGERTFTGDMNFSQSDVNKFNSTSISVYGEARNTHPSSQAITYLWEASVTVTYKFQTPKVSPITDLKINGSSSYIGPGPVTLSWTPPSYSGYFSEGPYIDLNVDDGDSWGESGEPSPGSITSSSYTFPESIINHVQNSNNQTATVYLTVYWYDASWNFSSYNSNKVTFNYKKQTKYSVKSYINNEWKQCLVYYYDGSKWIACIPNYYNGEQWQICSS